MNAKCLICSDFLTSCSIIFVTPCGHLFHHLCLIQWIERSRSCPQCRSRTTEKSIHRIYLSVEENGEVVDTNTLQNRVDSLQFQIKLKDMDIKNSKERYTAAKVEEDKLRDEIKVNEKKMKELHSGTNALKEQLVYLKLKLKEKERIEDELIKVKNKLHNMQHVEMIITGSIDQVNDMLRHNRDPQSLTVLVSALKKELMDSDKKRKQMQGMLKEVQKESLNYKMELVQLNKNYNKLQLDVEAHKYCERERVYLKSKISQLIANTEVSGNAMNSSIRRVVSESPMPNQQHKLDANNEDKNTSLTLPEKVKEIKESDSPYLNVKSSNIGLLPGLLNYNSKYRTVHSTVGNTKYSIFKHSSAQEVDNNKKPNEMIYDGLGGHSKEELFPIPSHLKGMKRPKTTSTIASAKFRKLAPGSQRKLNEFFDQ